MLPTFAQADTARTPGIGRRWRNWLAFADDMSSHVSNTRPTDETRARNAVARVLTLLIVAGHGGSLALDFLV
jgi:hypothetical protein